MAGVINPCKHAPCKHATAIKALSPARVMALVCAPCCDISGNSGKSYRIVYMACADTLAGKPTGGGRCSHFRDLLVSNYEDGNGKFR